VFELVDAIAQKVSPSLARRVETIVSESLGDAIEGARDVRFSYDSAAASLMCFLADDIPRVATPVPAAVSQVRFNADLSALTAIGPSTHRVLAALRG
jgi:hypothetical protein